MSFAWLFFLILIAFLSYFAQDKYKNHNVSKALLVLLLAFITGFGGLTTADHSQYVSIYKSYTSFSDFEFSFSTFFGRDNAYESGFILLMIICNLIGLDEAGFFFVVALIINGAIIRYVYKQKMPVWTLWAVFVSGIIAVQTNLIRQSLALAIILFFFDALFEGKYIKYIIGVVLASLFHSSALFFLLFIPLCFIKSEKGQIVLNFVLLGLLIFSVLIATGLIQFDVLSLVDQIATYEKYLSADNDVGASQRIAHSLIFTSLSLLVCLLFGKVDKNAATMICMAAVISNIAVSYPNVGRLKCYFITLGYMALVQYFGSKQYAQKYEKAVINGIQIVFTLYFISVILRTFVFTDAPPVFQEVYSLDKFFK